MSSYCSITASNKKYCYSFNSLLKIANAWNFLNPKNIINIKPNISSNELFELLEKKFSKYTISNNNYWAWIDIIRLLNKNMHTKINYDMRMIEKNDLRPSQPVEWIKNKREWLSNYDIEHVLSQFANKEELLYKFHGVFTIDFAMKNKDNTCKYYSNCDINMKNIIKSGKKYFGFVTNLCKYDEPGTHWTSSFFILDPELKSYGAYYYDSVKRPIPKLLKPVFKDIQKQMHIIYPNIKFKIYVNNIQHQLSDTECGVFSIAFQTRWLKLLFKNKQKASFNDVINFHKMTDNAMYFLRNRYFRPNVKTILKPKI